MTIDLGGVTLEAVGDELFLSTEQGSSRCEVVNGPQGGQHAACAGDLDVSALLGSHVLVRGNPAAIEVRATRYSQTETSGMLFPEYRQVSSTAINCDEDVCEAAWVSLLSLF